MAKDTQAEPRIPMWYGICEKKSELIASDCHCHCEKHPVFYEESLVVFFLQAVQNDGCDVGDQCDARGGEGYHFYVATWVAD